MSLSDSLRKRDPIEQDFLDALKRLMEGRPENKKLMTSARAGKLKINAVNVALEAGHSRTLIALEDCRYPKVREAVKLAQGGKKTLPTTYTHLITNLRADLAALKAEKRMLETTMADHVLARRKAEVSARRDAAEAARLRKQVVEFEKIVHLPIHEAKLPRLVLIRGLPGSGKTAMAMGYVNDGYKHFEADHFFLMDGEFRFDAAKQHEAFAWCLNQTREALDGGELVCVANVFATMDDIKPYTELGVGYQVVEAKSPGQSIHKVPADMLRAIGSSWVPTDRLVEALKGNSRVTGILSSITLKKEKR